MTDVTHILSQIEAGNCAAAAQLWPLVYDELRQLAAARLAQEKPGQTLQATALVHEAYLRLVGPANQHGFDSRGHFFAAAAEAMRRILVDRARRRRALRHGADMRRVEFDERLLIGNDDDPTDLLDLNDALSRLEQQSPQRAQLVKLRFFAGLTMPEIAKALGISLATAERQWVYARTWLYATMRDAADHRAGKEIP